jgi:hypothetical protein
MPRDFDLSSVVLHAQASVAVAAVLRETLVNEPPGRADPAGCAGRVGHRVARAERNED